MRFSRYWNGSNFTSGIFVALIGLAVALIIFYRTPLGAKIRICGDNLQFAVYSGINAKKMMFSAQVIGGLFAGAAAAVEIFGLYDSYYLSVLTNVGMDGLLAAVMAKKKPVFVPITAFVMAYIGCAAAVLNANTNIPIELVTMLQAVIVLFVAAEEFLGKTRRKVIFNVSVKEKEWDYYNRISIENINSGTSIKYSFQYNTIKNFTSTNVRASDILYVDNFIEKQDAVMLQYYHGNTSDGKYNDNSGSAYLVKFYEDGTVKTLYVGNFANGTFNDNTNNAWNIVYAEELGYYVYHSGIFKNGSAIDNSIEPITQQQINEKISGYDFDCPLKWKDTPDSKFMR